MEQVIKHDAVVKEVQGQRVRVAMLQSSACSGCAARQMCNSAEAKEKEVDVYTPDAVVYRVGQEVVLEGRLSDGRLAALWAYGLPLLLLLPVLFVATRLTGSETQGALWALGTVGIYYAVLAFCFRQRLQRQFSFRLTQKDKNSQ